MARKLRRASGQLTLQDADFIEFPGLDHGECSTPESLQDPVVPTVADWISRRVGPAW